MYTNKETMARIDNYLKSHDSLYGLSRRESHIILGYLTRNKYRPIYIGYTKYYLDLERGTIMQENHYSVKQPLLLPDMCQPNSIRFTSLL